MPPEPDADSYDAQGRPSSAGWRDAQTTVATYVYDAGNRNTVATDFYDRPMPPSDETHFDIPNTEADRDSSSKKGKRKGGKRKDKGNEENHESHE